MVDKKKKYLFPEWLNADSLARDTDKAGIKGISGVIIFATLLFVLILLAYGWLLRTMCEKFNKKADATILTSGPIIDFRTKQYLRESGWRYNLTYEFVDSEGNKRHVSHNITIPYSSSIKDYEPGKIIKVGYSDEPGDKCVIHKRKR